MHHGSEFSFHAGASLTRIGLVQRVPLGILQQGLQNEGLCKGFSTGALLIRIRLWGVVYLSYMGTTREYHLLISSDSYTVCSDPCKKECLNPKPENPKNLARSTAWRARIGAELVVQEDTL